jgi:protein TonB
MSARFDLRPVAHDEPIFVMIVADGVDESGDAAPGPGADLREQAVHAAALSAIPPQSESGVTSSSEQPRSEAGVTSSSEQPLTEPAPSQSTNSGTSLPLPPVSDARADPAMIAVDKSVQNPVGNTVDKRDSPSEAAPAPRPVSSPRKVPVAVPAATAKPQAQNASVPTASRVAADAPGTDGLNATGVSTTATINSGNSAGGASAPRRIVRPDYLNGPPVPVYPQSARSRRQQGKVIVRVVISSVGQPTSIDLQQSSGFDVLDRAALDAVRRAQFRPYAENGVPRDALVDIPFDFVLRN